MPACGTFADPIIVLAAVIAHLVTVRGMEYGA